VVSWINNPSPLINQALCNQYKMKVNSEDPRLDSLRKVCEHNGAVAKGEKLDMISGMWYTLACLFETEDMFTTQSFESLEISQGRLSLPKYGLLKRS
jgi:hypothetical protein